jgi:hypothetical protein
MESNRGPNLFVVTEAASAAIEKSCWVKDGGLSRTFNRPWQNMENSAQRTSETARVPKRLPD